MSTAVLLFLLPPSCMVVPIGKLANKFSFSSNLFSNSTTASNSKSFFPPMSNNLDLGMDFQSGELPATNSEARGRNPLPSANSSREPSMASSGRSTPYHERMDMDVVPDIEEPNSERLELSYETEQEKALRMGKVPIQQDTTRPPAVNNEASLPNVLHEDDVINIQIPYDPQAPTEPELWSGSFHPISLHGSIEHFASDAKNIKISLNFLAKYIQGKQVNGNQVNDLGNFDGMRDVIWNFISSVYVLWNIEH